MSDSSVSYNWFWIYSRRPWWYRCQGKYHIPHRWSRCNAFRQYRRILSTVLCSQIFLQSVQIERRPSHHWPAKAVRYHGKSASKTVLRMVRCALNITTFDSAARARFFLQKLPKPVKIMPRVCLKTLKRRLFSGFKADSHIFLVFIPLPSRRFL